MNTAAGTTAVPLDKHEQTQVARAALVGITVHTMRDKHGQYYIATRWNYDREFRTLAALASWLDRVGAPA